jgi:ATP-dependent DNA helicase RecQ
LAALLGSGTTLCVSPHIALMGHQTHALNDRVPSQPAAFINSTLTAAQKRAVLKRVVQGTVKLLYVAPEGLASSHVLDALRATCIDLLVVDEAHCTVLDATFRPEYLRIRAHAAALGIRQTVALTATAPKGFVRDQIVSLLGLSDPVTVSGPLDRPKLVYWKGDYLTGAERLQALRSILHDLVNRKGLGRGILYVGTRRDVQMVGDLVESWGYSDAWYHGKMTGKIRGFQEGRFRSGSASLMIATKAFGLGIDVPDVRFVVVLFMPPSVSELYQLWGRAGRDGSPAYCLLLSATQDHRVQSALVEESLENLERTVPSMDKRTRRRLRLGSFRAFLRDEMERAQHFAMDRSGCIRAALLHSQNRRLTAPVDPCCGNCSDITQSIAATNG